MKQRNLDKLNSYLAKWRGANAFINTYVDENERLIIAFKRPENPTEFVGVCFFNCKFLSGPTRWSNCNVQCQHFAAADGEIGIEVRDSEGGFFLQFYGPVVVGDGEFVLPRD